MARQGSDLREVADSHTAAAKSEQERLHTLKQEEAAAAAEYEELQANALHLEVTSTYVKAAAAASMSALHATQASNVRFCPRSYSALAHAFSFTTPYLHLQAVWVVA